MDINLKAIFFHMDEITTVMFTTKGILTCINNNGF